MELGKYNRRITLQRLQPGQRPTGQPVDEWVDVARPWAWIRGKSGRETIAADMEVAETSYSMRIRYRADVQADWRVAYGGDVYRIRQVLPDLARREHVDLVVALISVQE
ncbi:phage head closure protein [Cupriavidus respiraculi]|uniref:Head-tail adaptor protein n=1 Tax=Cupriavidus respiraculi TaxID=195930 RepID=A0ABM8XV45_9BURK|nr:phage head closure protein [Cupriavidus respiraculi]CAG9184269.1 hypothetical protein LMG21510_05055 [Cupriavidus respiraculi]